MEEEIYLRPNLANILDLLHDGGKILRKKLTTTETYSTANVQEVIDKSLQEYIIKHMLPPTH